MIPLIRREQDVLHLIVQGVRSFTGRARGDAVQSLIQKGIVVEVGGRFKLTRDGFETYDVLRTDTYNAQIKALDAAYTHDIAAAEALIAEEAT